MAKIKAEDIEARLGGEEFVVIMPDAGAEEGQAMGNALCSRLAYADWQHIPVTVSIGVAAYVPGDKVESLLSRADGFLYKAKASGRNCVIGN
ncbi:GGDEF domain-containing protein [Planomicrobium stackebrandtii]|nr:GGDEF domain-containing protein [Planomicrobium stackebrandtii]